MNRQQHRAHALEKFGRAAVFAEQGFAFGAADARTVEIDVHHRLAIAKADEERLALDRQRHVRRIPAVRAEEQVLLVLEAEQRDRLELSVRRLVEHDRIVRLDVAELGRERERGHHVVAVRGAARGDDAQVLVVDVVQQDGVGSCALPRFSAARAA